MHVLHHCDLNVMVSSCARMLHLITVCIVYFVSVRIRWYNWQWEWKWEWFQWL